MAGSGAFFTFVPVLLLERGLSLFQIGTLSALLTLVTLVVSPLWASLADFLGRTKPFVVQATGIGLLSALVLPHLFQFSHFLVVQTILAFLTPPAEGLLVTAVFRAQGTEDRGAAYSSFALWGSVGWALGVASAGWIVSRTGITGAFYYGGALLGTAILCVLRLKEPGKGATDMPGRGLRTALTLLSDRNLRLLLFALLPSALALNATARFFPVHLTQAGGSALLLGLAYAVPAILEVPVFLGIGRIAPRLGQRRPLLLWSTAVYTILVLLLALFSHPTGLFVAYVLLAPLAWPPFIASSTAFIAELVPSRYWVTGQTLFSLWLWSVGGAVGPLVAGFLGEAFGLPRLFVALGGWHTLTFLLLWGLVRERAKGC